MVMFLDSVRSKKLCSLKLDLGSEETQALVRALESRVEEAEMDLMDLDIEAFTMYSGLGGCGKVRFSYYILDDEDTTTDVVRGMLCEWASNKDWETGRLGHVVSR